MYSECLAKEMSKRNLGTEPMHWVYPMIGEIRVRETREIAPRQLMALMTYFKEVMRREGMLKEGGV